MNITITGGTGFIGKHLITALLKCEHTLTVISRSPKKAQTLLPHQVNILSWDDLTEQHLSTQDSIIHLAGHNVGDKRWSTPIKQQIMDSRTKTTQHIAKTCLALGNQSPRILSASAIGIYGLSHHYPQQPIPVDESWPIPEGNTPDFLSNVGQQWEAAWRPLLSSKIPLTIMRFGVVIHPTGGVLKKLLPAVKFGMAGKLGNGEQWISWIHLKDLINAILWLLDNQHITGAINVTHHQPVQQKTFIKTLAAQYHRPCIAHLPAWLVRALFGEMGNELLLGGQKVMPERLIKSDYRFALKDIQEALSPTTE